MTPTILSPPQLDAMRRGALSMLVVRAPKQPHEDWRPANYCDIHKMVDGDFPMRKGEPIVIGWGAVNYFGDEGYICPLGRVGGEIVCKERFQFWTEFNTTPTRDVPSGSRINFPDDGNKWDARIRPAREMPLEYARFTLRLLSVEVRKVNTITEDEAWACGLTYQPSIGWYDGEQFHRDHRDAFANLYAGDFDSDFAWFARVELIDNTQPQPASAAGEGGERHD